MAFNHLGDESVQRSSTGRDLLQNRFSSSALKELADD
jgi:hypothetical protein